MPPKNKPGGCRLCREVGRDCDQKTMKTCPYNPKYTAAKDLGQTSFNNNIVGNASGNCVVKKVYEDGTVRSSSKRKRKSAIPETLQVNKTRTATGDSGSFAESH